MWKTSRHPNIKTTSEVTIPQIHRLEPTTPRSSSTLFSLLSALYSLLSTQLQNGPPTISLEPYRDDIITLYHHGISTDAISSTLETCHNIQVKERTIQSRLRKWGIRKRHRTTTGDEALHARIKMMFIQDKLTDKAMLNMLQQEGYGISERTLRRLRFKLGLYVRTSEQEQIVVPQPLPEGPTV
ncbi:hypothetical protein ACN38_g9644 [Penicillium nordicum]|uniref:Clr5 domain-containing protein n=1 Tax=Penicillium nordicum TaxID=229535 RepID=A0A0M8P2U7_9EURO|nr:hypothetical protein ACN38_g9644 [Penicillium nordicum]